MVDERERRLIFWLIFCMSAYQVSRASLSISCLGGIRHFEQLSESINMP